MNRLPSYFPAILVGLLALVLSGCTGLKLLEPAAMTTQNDCPDLTGTWSSDAYEVLAVAGDGTHQESGDVTMTLEVTEQQGCHFSAINRWGNAELAGVDYGGGVINPDGNWITIQEVGESPVEGALGRVLGRLLDDHQMTWEYAAYSHERERAIVFSTILAREGSPLRGEDCPDMLGTWHSTPFAVLNVYGDGRINQQPNTTNTLEVVHQTNCHFRGINSWQSGELGGSEHVAGVLHSDGLQITILEVGEHPEEGTRAFVRGRLSNPDRLEWDYVGLSGIDAWKGQAFTTALTRTNEARASTTEARTTALTNITEEQSRASCPEMTGTWSSAAWEGLEVFADGTHDVVNRSFKRFTIDEQMGCTVKGTNVYAARDGSDKVWMETVIGVINAEQGLITSRSVAPGPDGLTSLITHRMVAENEIHAEYTGVSGDSRTVFVYLLALMKE
ncbi:MAG: hypothetical protein KDE53_19045 [Caldilineaceae bacterium]|nr:hypothetical protein [Caldilineaceae bacterium]